MIKSISLTTVVLLSNIVCGQNLPQHFSSRNEEPKASIHDVSPQQIHYAQFDRPNDSGTSAESGCGVHTFTHQTWSEGTQFSRGLTTVPRNSVRPSNLRWELPILAATGILIAKVDRPADNRIQSKSLQDLAGRWSNIGLGMEIGSAALAYGAGCHGHNSYLRDTGFKALAAMAAAGMVDLGLKLAFDRQFPYGRNSTGDFWGGGRSFPSGHSATSFAFAAVIAHRYPQNKWVKWGAYALDIWRESFALPGQKAFPVRHPRGCNSRIRNRNLSFFSLTECRIG